MAPKQNKPPSARRDNKQQTPDSDNDERDQQPSSGAKVSSTTSLGKRRSFSAKNRGKRRRRPGEVDETTVANTARNSQPRPKSAESPNSPQQQQQQQQQQPASPTSTMSNPRSSEYGSQSSPLRVPIQNQPVKVALLGAAGGIGQPLALLLMLHSEYVQHLALYDLAHTEGVVADLGHIDRQCKVTAHTGPEQLADAVRGARVIVCTAGLAQKPGQSRDDLFVSNAKIMYNLAKVCAQVAPDAFLAIVSNPVNSLVPLVCELYMRMSNKSAHADTSSDAALKEAAAAANKQTLPDCCRKIFGVTTLDVVRSSTLMAQSALFKPEPHGLFRDPSKISVPVVGGHAGKTIIPLLSQATPKQDKKRLQDDKATTSALITSIQEAGIHVLNAKKGKGTATLAMAYAACRFTIALLRAQQGEANIVECAYVRNLPPVINDLEYFATPMLIGKDGYVRSMGVGKLLPFEQQMIDEATRELHSSIAKGEDFAREQWTSEVRA